MDVVDEPAAADPADAALTATGVRRAFGTVQAVVSADLAIAPGQVTALIGPNGAGKTTLMLMLAGLLAPDAGTITVGGANMRRSPVKARTRVGWMPDTLGTWDSLTCLEVVTTFARAYGIKATDARARAFELLTRFQLAEFASRPARVLSRGQKQRLSLARAIVHDPAVLILDEPASGLDPRARAELRTVLRELAAEGKAILISSHVLAELDEMVDDAVFMFAGSTRGTEASEHLERARRRYSVIGLDAAALQKALAAQTRAWETTEAGAIVEVADAADAAALNAELVAAGVAVAALAPVGSALESTYLSLEGEQR